MPIETRGGFDYTGADCIGWMRAAGFRDVRVVRPPGPHAPGPHASGPHSMVIGTR